MERSKKRRHKQDPRPQKKQEEREREATVKIITPRGETSSSLPPFCHHGSIYLLIFSLENTTKMCGIGLVFLDSSDNYDASDQQNALRQCLLRRGPDYQGELVVGNDQHPLWMVGSVLHIQGESLCRQPVQDSSGNVLLWNGEVFGGDVEVPKGCSDTTIVSQLLQQSCEGKDADSMGSCVIDALSRIEGPFAFIFYHALTDTIYFGRDSIGRRSLVLTIEKGNNGSDDDDVSNTSRIKSISSVSYGLATTSPSDNGAEILLEEVQIGGIYRVSSSGDRSTVTKLSWPSTRVSLRRELQLNCNLPESERSTFEGSVGRFSDILHQAVRKRLVRIGFNTNDESENDQVMASSSDNFDSFQSSSFTIRSTRVGVLFSGGIDSLLLAAVLHLALEDAHEPIDLFNVAFVEENGTTSSPAPDRLGGIVGLLELKVIICKVEKIRFEIYLTSSSSSTIEIIPNSRISFSACRCQTK